MDGVLSDEIFGFRPLESIVHHLPRCSRIRTSKTGLLNKHTAWCEITPEIHCADKLLRPLCHSQQVVACVPPSGLVLAQQGFVVFFHDDLQALERAVFLKQFPEFLSLSRQFHVRSCVQQVSIVRFQTCCGHPLDCRAGGLLGSTSVPHKPGAENIAEASHAQTTQYLLYPHNPKQPNLNQESGSTWGIAVSCTSSRPGCRSMQPMNQNGPQRDFVLRGFGQPIKSLATHLPASVPTEWPKKHRDW